MSGPSRRITRNQSVRRGRRLNSGNHAAGSATYLGFTIAADISTLLLGLAAWRRKRAPALGSSAPLIIAELFFASTIIIEGTP